MEINKCLEDPNTQYSDQYMPLAMMPAVVEAIQNAGGGGLIIDCSDLEKVTQMSNVDAIYCWDADLESWIDLIITAPFKLADDALPELLTAGNVALIDANSDYFRPGVVVTAVQRGLHQHTAAHAAPAEPQQAGTVEGYVTTASDIYSVALLSSSDGAMSLVYVYFTDSDIGFTVVGSN